MTIKQKINGNQNIQATGDIILNQDIPGQIEYSKKLLDEYSCDSALSYLLDLKRRIWDIAGTMPIDKYKILKNIGIAKIQMNLFDEAAPLFIEAYQYNKDDEKAKYNYAYGNLLLKEDETVKIWANKVIELNQQNIDAYALLIDTAKDNLELIEVETRIPQNIKDDYRLNFCRGVRKFKEGDLTESANLITKAISQNRETVNYKGFLASIYLQEIINKDLIAGHNQEKIDYAKKALELLDDAINEFENKEIIKYKAEWFAHRGTAKNYLGDIKGAIKDTEKALELKPNDFIILNNLALAYRENNELQKAIRLLEGIQDNPEFEQRSILLAEFYRFDRNYEKAIEILGSFILINKNEHLLFEAKKLLSLNYKEAGNIKASEELNNELNKISSDDILVLVNQSELLESRGEKIKAKEIILNAYNKVNGTTNVRYIAILSDSLYKYNLFEQTKNLLEKISDIDTENPSYDKVNKSLIGCYMKLNLYSEALEMCQKLKRKFPNDDSLIEIEGYIHEKSGKLEDAYKVYSDYLKEKKDDLEIRIRLAYLNLRLENYEELDKFLLSEKDENKLSLELLIHLAQLYSERNFPDKMLDTIFETRRKFINESTAHSHYIWLIMENAQKVKKLLDIEIADINTVVTLRKNTESKYYVIVDRNDINTSLHEIPKNSQTAIKLIGKKIGDKVDLSNNQFSKDEFEIDKIESIYVNAYRESMDEFNQFFPEDKSLNKIVFDPNENVTTILKKMFENDHEREKTIEQMNSFYIEGKFTMGMIADHLKRDYFEVFGNNSTDPKLGILCTSGKEEVESNINFLDGSKKIVMDLTSITTLAILNITHDKISFLGKIGIHQSIKDELSMIIRTRKGYQNQGFFSIGMQGDNLIRYEVTKEQIENNIKFLEDIQKWIKENCEVIGLDAKYLNEESKYENVNVKLGNSFLYSILTAKQTKGILLSDDYPLRMLALNEYDVNGSWTQALLQKLLKLNNITKEEYNQAIVKLLVFNYRYLIIDAEILLEACRQARWLPAYPFDVVIKVLEGPQQTAHLAVKVAVNLIWKIWLLPISSLNRDSILYLIFDVLTRTRNVEQTMYILKSILYVAFKFLPLAYAEIEDLINKWMEVHIQRNV